MSSSNRAARRIFRRTLGAFTGRRGATTVEYALILVAVVLLAAGSWKLLGGALSKRSNVAGDTVSGDGTGSSSGGGTGSGSGGGGGGGGRGSSASGDKATAASKVTVGGVGGAAGESGGGASSGKPSREGSSSESGGSGGGGPIESIGGRDTGGGDVTEGFTPKRWFGIGLLAAGVFALGYVIMSMRRAKKNADDMDKDGKGKKGMPPKGPAPPIA